jgi:asparagine N-glycosylation enzyme membrane subunit Stt3
MPTEQKYDGTRKRSKKIGSRKQEQLEDMKSKRSTKIENPIIVWAKKEWTIIIGLIVIFIISLFLRSYFYYPVATENGFLLSGNDPFYHKRVIDYAQNYFTHIQYDPLLDYPLVGVNPRPPAYDWSNAVSGLFLSPILNGDIEATTWYIFLFSPALWGALTIFPVYFLTRDMFGRKPAMIAAFFMGIMASHIERSPLGFSDHDAMVVFFVVTNILFLAKAIGKLKNRYWVKDWKNPVDITSGVKDFFMENPVSIAYSIMCGLSIAAIALIWKGFPYVLVIILGSFLVLAIINHLRKFDSLGIFVCMYIAFAVGMALSLPWYAMFNIPTWIQPMYMMMAFIILGIAFIPTRDLPWIIVIPAFLLIMGIALGILQQFQPDTVEALITGGGYFIKSKLYSTIAEAQAPDTSRLAISYGPVTFYLTLIGLVIAAIAIPKHWKMDFFLIIVWCTLAIYMALSAVRFMFNATPVFAVLSGWVTWNIIERLDPTLRTFKKIETRFVYLYIGITTLIIMSTAYWWVYLEHDNFLFLQVITGVGLFGVFIAVFTAWLMMRYNFMVGILIYVSYIIFWIWYTFDALINDTFKGGEIIWDKIPWELFIFGIALLVLIFIPMFLFIFFRQSVSGSKLDLRHVSIALFIIFLVLTPNVMFAIDASIPYETKGDYDPDGKTFGAFGHSFPSDYWQAGMDWLSEQDNEIIIEERPAFISWWDYGFWCLYLGEHPTVADNFQAGYQLAGSFIASTNETQAISLFAVRILEGDFKSAPRKEFSPEIQQILIEYLDPNNRIGHPNYNEFVEIFLIESKSADEQSKMITEVEDNPNKYGNFDDLKIRNAKYAVARHTLEKLGQERIVDLLTELEAETENNVRYFAVDTRLFPFSASNTGIFYAPIKLADRDIADFIKYYAIVDVRDNRESEWRSYSDRPVPTEELEDEIDLNDIVDTHGAGNVRIKEYEIKYTDDFYNSMFYKCYIGYTYDDLFPEAPTDEMQSVPGIFGQLAENQPMQGWNMTHFRLVYRTAYWTPHNQTELQEITDQDRGWVAMSEFDAIKRIQDLESDGRDNDNNGQVDDRGEGGTWSPSYRGGGVFFLKYYHGAILRGQVLTDSAAAAPIKGARVTVFDEYGIPHDSSITDSSGNYNLTVPFGNIIITISKDGYPAGFEESFEMRAQKTEQTTLNTTTFEITEQQAMRETNYILNEDLKVPIAGVSGQLYWEKNNNEEFNVDEDRPITDAETILFLDAKQARYNLSYTTTEISEDGAFGFADVVPGSYKLTAFVNGHYIEHPNDVVVTSNEGDVTQNFPIKQGIVTGNLTYTNSTDYLPYDVTIKLHDSFNNSIMTKTLYNNATYLFDELLPGDYLVYVDTPGIKYNKNNFTLDIGEEKTADLELIPLIPVSGVVYNDVGLDGFDPGDAIINAQVEFYNIDNSSLSSVLSTNSTGHFQGNITQGNYTLYSHYTVETEDYVHVSSLSVKNGSFLDLEISLEPGFWINGTVTKQVNTPVEPAVVNFIFNNENNDPVRLPVPTNSQGLYRAFIPYRFYEIEITHISTGNITYLYYNSTSLLEPDVIDLVRGNINSNSNNNNAGQSTSKSRQTSSESPKVTKNIHMYEASRMWGYIYWDHNGDGEFHPDNASIDIVSYEPEPSVPVPPPNFETPPTRANGNDENNNQHENEIQTYFSQDTSGVDNELMIGARLALYHETETLYTYTNENGYYSVFLPPGNTTIEMDDPRFQSLKLLNPVENLSIFMPFNKSYQVFGRARNFSVIPENITLKGNTWNDLLGNFEFDENNIVTDVPIEFRLLNPGIKDSNNESLSVTVISDSVSGDYIVDLLPGEYEITVDYDASENVKYTYSGFMSIPFYNPQIAVREDIGLSKYVLANISIDTQDFQLNESELENVTIKIYAESGARVRPLPFEVNETIYEGYILPLEYTIWLEYSAPEGKNVAPGTEYVYFGNINISEMNNEFKITLHRGTLVTFTSYIDSDNSGNFTLFEERPEAFNITLSEPTGGTLNIKYENGTIKQILMPGISYKIIVNDTRTQQATHGFRYVRYISDFSFDIAENETETFVDILMIKYINLSGKIYYDENENEVGDINEVYADVPIHFTGPMDFSVISNASGRYHKFVLPGEYFATIDADGFEFKPEVDSYNVSLDDTFYDVEMIPIKVRFFGFTYFDANRDIEYNPDSETKLSLKDRKLGDVTIKFAKNILIEPDSGPDLPSTEPLEESAVTVKSDPITGEYEVYLPPGEYNINAYIPTTSGATYCGLDLRYIGRTMEYEYNISLYKGRLVEGNVFYRDSELREVYDLDSRETGTGLKFENLETGGSKMVLYRNEGTFDKLYLPYGNYSITTEFLTEEYGLNMEYTLTETILINEEINWYTFEMNKDNLYSFELSLDGGSVVELHTADRHQEVFTINIENTGNTYNVIDLRVDNVPPGWYVHLSNSTIPLDITGKYNKATLTVDITIPVEAYAENRFTITGEPRGDPGAAETLDITVNTPPIFDFIVDYETDLERGIGFNDELNLVVDVTKTGNAADKIFFKFYNVKETWNVTIAEAISETGDPDEDAPPPSPTPGVEVEYRPDIDSYALNMRQEEKTKTVTIRIKSPEITNASVGELSEILVNMWSENKPEIEYTQEIDVEIRYPDIVVKNIKFKNADLKEGTNVTIQAITDLKYTHVAEVNVSLYVNEVWVENKTVTDLNEDSEHIIEFFWQVETYNLTDERGKEFDFKITVNDDETIIENSYDNNKLLVSDILIGELPSEEEFNWRPIIALISLLIVFLVIYGIYRWRRKF